MSAPTGDDAPAEVPDDDPADLEALRRYADVLAAGVEQALPGWVERSVRTLVEAWDGPVDVGRSASIDADLLQAGAAAVARVMPPLRALLAEDVDRQQGNPLAIVRRAVPIPTELLAALGVPPVVRDAMAERQFPDDRYDLTPASFSELDPSLHEPGLMWGAAKAHVHLARRRDERRRTR